MGVFEGSGVAAIYARETARSVDHAAMKDVEDPIWMHAPGVVGRAFASLLIDDAIRRDLIEGVDAEHWTRDRLFVPRMVHWFSGEIATRPVDVQAIARVIIDGLVWPQARADVRMLCDMGGASQMLVSILEIYVQDVVTNDEVSYADLLSITDDDVAEFMRLLSREVI